MKTPFIDLQAQHRHLKNELISAIEQVMERADFSLGADVTRFEEEFAAFCGTRYAVGVGSGLAALELSLRAFGVGLGDEVIVPTHTFIATAAAATFAGACPVLVDVDPLTYNIDVTQLEEAITERTRAIIPVHLYGLPAEMDAIMQLAEKYNLVVIEDACQAHGACYRGRRTGSLGHAAAFSFYPTKNLGACGEAGIVTTNNAQVAEQIKSMRNCGRTTQNCHELPPFNHRLDTLQAAILRVKLRHLEDWLQARQQRAALYNELLAESNIDTPFVPSFSTHVYHLYVIRTPQRDALRAHLSQCGVSTGIHYPQPVHSQPFYARQRTQWGAFPVAEKLCGEILSLPMFPELTPDQAHYVSAQIVSFFKSVPEAAVMAGL